MNIPKVNIEYFHNAEMSNAENYAWASEGDPCEAAIVRPMFDGWFVSTEPSVSPEEELLDTILNGYTNCDLPEYECARKFLLPSGSRDIVLGMARASLALPIEEVVIKGLECGFTYETFCLDDFLRAAYPRNTRTGRLKGNTGGFYLSGGWDLNEGEADDPRNKARFREYALHRVFAGIGVTVMNESRKAIDQLATDDEVIMTATEQELLLVIL